MRISSTILITTLTILATNSCASTTGSSRQIEESGPSTSQLKDFRQIVRRHAPKPFLRIVRRAEENGPPDPEPTPESKPTPESTPDPDGNLSPEFKDLKPEDFGDSLTNIFAMMTVQKSRAESTQNELDEAIKKIAKPGITDGEKEAIRKAAFDSYAGLFLDTHKAISPHPEQVQRFIWHRLGPDMPKWPTQLHEI